MSDVIRILGIDPGLRRTGWGVVEVEGSSLRMIACGASSTDARAPTAERLLTIMDALAAVIAEHTPAEAAIEKTFVNSNPASALALGQARAAAMLAPAAARLPISEYAPNEVKKAVVGAGHADKRQIQAMIGVLLPAARPKTADAADALAIAVCHAHMQGARRALAARARAS